MDDRGDPDTEAVLVTDAYAAARELLRLAEEDAARIRADADRYRRQREQEAELIVAKARRLLTMAEERAAAPRPVVVDVDAPVPDAVDLDAPVARRPRRRAERRSAGNGPRAGSTRSSPPRSATPSTAPSTAPSKARLNRPAPSGPSSARARQYAGPSTTRLSHGGRHGWFRDPRWRSHADRQAVRRAGGLLRRRARRPRHQGGPRARPGSPASRSTTSSWARCSRPAPARSPPARPRSTAASR